MKELTRKMIRWPQAVCQEVVKEVTLGLDKSKPRKILFDHLPKCGGSSLNKYLKSNYSGKKTFIIDSKNPHKSLSLFKLKQEGDRHAYDLVTGHLGNHLLEYVDPESIKITVLRDPIERIVSHYYYAKNRPDHYLHEVILSNNLELLDYARYEISNELNNWYTTHFSGLTHAEAMKNPEVAVKLALKTLTKKFTLVGFLDDLSSFVHVLEKKAQLPRSFENKRVNITQNRPEINEVSSSVLRNLSVANSLDVEVYKRTKEYFKLL